jgi:TRAP-type C4-dicarboxylate transport system substrate-binding protein
MWTPAPVNADAILLKYANFPPEQTFPCIQMERWKKEVEKRTGGAVDIQTFPEGTLLDTRRMMDGIIAGEADIGCLCMAYHPNRFVITNATGMPLGIPDARTGSLVLWELYQKYKPESFSKVKVLTMFSTAPANILSRVPVRNLGDIKGLVLGSPGGTSPILDAWGAKQMDIFMSETSESLQNSVLQGLFSSSEAMKDLGYSEYFRYVTLTHSIVYPFAVIMNWNTWHSLPMNVRQVIDNLGPEQAEWTGRYLDYRVKSSIEWSQRTHQVEFIEFSPQEKIKWDKALSLIIDRWIKHATQKGYPSEAILEDIKVLIRNYSR